MLYIAFLPYMIMAAELLSKKAFQLYGIMYFKNTYIHSINTPSYPKTREILEEFNSMADNAIVSFDKIADGRPLDIAEMTPMDLIIAPDAVGIAYPRLSKCTIHVKPGLEDIIYREVLLHEYLHCYGYDHSTEPTDLMYFSVTYVDKEENIRQYALKVKAKFYE